MKNVKEIGILIVFVVLAIVVSPFLLIGAAIYVAYRIRKAILRKRLLERIQQEWFPKGKYAFFLYSDSKKWKNYFEQELVPKIQEMAVVKNWSTRYEDGWAENSIEASILSLFRPVGAYYPMAIIFFPSGEVKTFQFYSDYIKKLKSGKGDYDNMEEEFVGMVQIVGRGS